MTKEDKKKKKKERISTAPCLIEANGRVYVGCDRYNQRHEICICEAHGCSRRRKCQPYIEAKKMQEDWKDLYGSSLSHIAPTKKRRRRRNAESLTNASISNPLPKKRRRKSQQKEEQTSTKRKRKRKTEDTTTKRKRKRKS